MNTQLEMDMAIESHRPELTRYCRRKLGSQFDAEDAVQETLMRAWRSSDRLQQPAALRSWLYRIAGNVCADSVHRRSRDPVPTEECGELLEHPEALDPAVLVCTREDLRLALTAAVHHLPPRQRAVFVLREIERLEYEVIADRTRVPIGTVRSRLNRSRVALRRILAGALSSDDGW